MTRRSAPITFAAALLLLLCGCDSPLPTDPAARFSEVQARIARAKTSHEATGWLAMVADDGRPETRDLMLSFVTGESDLRALDAINLLDQKIWLEQQAVRKALAEYYLDPMQSHRRRAHLRFRIFVPNRDKYEEFRNLPDVVPVPAGLVHVERPNP
jgi:hypothetical protein